MMPVTATSDVARRILDGAAAVRAGARDQAVSTDDRSAAASSDPALPRSRGDASRRHRASHGRLSRRNRNPRAPRARLHPGPATNRHRHRVHMGRVLTRVARPPEGDCSKPHFPAGGFASIGPSWWRGERRVANACRAQVTLRDVLLSNDTASVTASINRLQTIGSLMEKQSRVASWGIRTVTGPILPGRRRAFVSGARVASRPSWRRCRERTAVYRRGIARRDVPLLRTEGRSTHRNGQPSLETYGGIHLDPRRAETAGAGVNGGAKGPALHPLR